MSRPDARCRSGMRPPGSVDTQAFGYDSMQEMIRIPANYLIERTGSMMILFAFYGRVGSTRLQDVAASKAWQVTRARQLIEPKGGVIVAEYFDIGHSRALPWQRRPQASQPLAALRDPDRGFNAVVIGEPQRAFYGNQFSLTYPIFEHFGVQLWVPEVGGPIDPGSEAHDLAMTLFGSQSKGERMRIKTRVRAAMGAQTAIQGRYLGGRPPYGYRLADAGAHPNTAHEPLVAKDDFDRVQAMIGARAWRHKPHKPAPTHRVYLLRKRLRCGLCQRRLQGHWVHAQPYYRCSYPPEYQAATGLDHPRTVYLREADLLPHLDQWLARLFDPDHLDPTLDALEQASNDHTATTQQLDAAEQTIANSKRQLAQYRAALAAGANPTEVTAWINQATAAKAAAEAERARLRATTPTTLDRAALRRIVTQAGGLLTALDKADRTRRAALYDKLGIEGVYQPTQRLVVVTADLVCQWLVSEGGLEPPRPCGH